MQRSGRLLQLLQALRDHRRAVTASTLAQRFQVSERTIYRDMQTLLELGVPVEGEAGTGFILRPGYFLPSMTFSREEADAVLLGLRFVLARADGELASAADTALLKITEAMGDDAESMMRDNGLTVGPVDRINGTRSRRSDEPCGIAVRERVVWPVALGFFDQVEMLAAWCELRGAFAISAWIGSEP